MAPSDPNGIPQHEPGAKLDAGKPQAHLMASGFSRALLEVAQVSTYGAHKYTPNGWKSVPDGVQRYSDAMLRHLLAESSSSTDDESGLLHAAQVAWNALARLELMLTPPKTLPTILGPSTPRESAPKEEALPNG